MRPLAAALTVALAACERTPVAVPVPPSPPTAEALAAAAAGDASFAAALHGVLGVADGNLCYAPGNARLALAMVAAGARGETATELAAALALPADAAEAQAGMAAMLASFAARADGGAPPLRATHVAMANRVWLDVGVPLLPAYAALLADRFLAPTERVGFATAPAAARAKVNAWVAERTATRVPELLGPSDVTAETRLLLTSALYLRAAWASPFVIGRTTPAPFTRGDGTVVQVPTMRQHAQVPYAETLTHQLLTLPYADGTLAMTLALPRPGTPLPVVEAALIATPAPTQVQPVEVALPRFTIGARLDLVAALGQLGVRRAFTAGQADFSGIDGRRDLIVGKVLHQAVVTVDEHGTEAAAATAVEMLDGTGAPSAPLARFIADRPFAFVIRETRTGVVLFVGRVADPTATS